MTSLAVQISAVALDGTPRPTWARRPYLMVLCFAIQAGLKMSCVLLIKCAAVLFLGYWFEYVLSVARPFPCALGAPQINMCLLIAVLPLLQLPCLL